MLVYIDHNVIACVVDNAPEPDAAKEMLCIESLRTAGTQFVLSAWSAYELARSFDDEYVRKCCDLVEALSPFWVGNTRKVQSEELLAYLGKGSGLPHKQKPFYTSFAEMMATYGGPILFGTTFRGLVAEWRLSPENIDRIRSAAQKTPPAILSTRKAWRNPEMKRYQPMIDREHLADTLNCSPSDLRVELLLKELPNVYRHCPAVAVEETMSRVRLADSFIPEESDAADFQHALGALAYCDYFVTRDKKLRQHSLTTVGRLKLSCKVVSRLQEIESTRA